LTSKSVRNHPDPRAASRARYQEWIETFDRLDDTDRGRIRSRIDALERPPLFSVVLPVHDPPLEFLERAVESVRRQLYPRWELCIADDASMNPRIRSLLEDYAARDERIHCTFRPQRGHISAASNSALELAQGDFVALLDHDDELAEHALYLVAEEIERCPDAVLVYSDEDKITSTGERYDPYFKTDWNVDLLLSQNMVGHLCVLRARAIAEVGGFRAGVEGSQDYDLVLRVVEGTPADRMRHVHAILYHWRAIPGSTASAGNEKSFARTAAQRALQAHVDRNGAGARVELGAADNLFRIRYPLPPEPPLVSVIVPTRDQAGHLRRSIESVLERTAYPNLELLVVDNDSQDAETRAYLAAIGQDPRARVLDHPGTFNYSSINNQAARAASGSVLCFLNSDVSVLSEDWLAEMVSHALRPEIGAVGAKLYYPDDTVQHAGVVLGHGDVATHAFAGLRRGQRASFNRSHAIQNVSAVTGACMVLRRELLEEVGGFDDEELAVAFTDVDLCLRLGERGYRTLLTPYAELYHVESATLGPPYRPPRRAQYHREVSVMWARWGERLLRDPFDVRGLEECAWPPLPERPWRTEEPGKRDCAELSEFAYELARQRRQLAEFARERHEYRRRLGEFEEQSDTLLREREAMQGHIGNLERRIGKLERITLRSTRLALRRLLARLGMGEAPER